MQQDAAEKIALNALIWLVGNEELLPVFLGSTGLGEDDLRSRLEEPEFLAAVLDFLTMNDDWVKECAQNINCDPMDFMTARQGLPGGETVHWT